MMKRTLLAAAALLLPGCSTLERYGIGGAPTVYCRGGLAVLDDRLLGPDQARLSLVRRVADADRLCAAPAVK
jgi:hypothetical protein